jgi:hypothetical protein
MPFEGRQRAAALDRCWSIYLSLTSAFILPEEFHAEFPVAAESVLITAALQLTVSIGSNLTLSLREEYVFERQRLTINRYGYNVIDVTGNNVLRADNLPFHRTDYRGRLLQHPPHHLHDKRDRVHSFSGNFDEFIARARTILSSR